MKQWASRGKLLVTRRPEVALRQRARRFLTEAGCVSPTRQPSSGMPSDLDR